jgi:hypothetical protein
MAPKKKINTNKSLNSKELKEDNLLFIEGVTLCNIENFSSSYKIDDVDNHSSSICSKFDSSLEISQDDFNSNSNSNSIHYDKIRNKFTSLEDWDYSNILCWYCSNKLTNKPVFIPTNINKNELSVLGNFCSFGCCIKYININYKNNNELRCNYINNLKYLFKIFNHKEVLQLTESPDFFTQQKYGGHLSEKEYLAYIKNLKNIY